MFANLHPRATVMEWINFATEHGAECYRSGYMRGVENAERDPNEPEIPPEEIADVVMPGWRDRAYDFNWQPDLEIETDGERVVADDGIEMRMAQNRTGRL
jgi:hypothetical protein